jgi:nucleolar protein 14
MFQSVALSKRYSPELFNFLSGIVFMSTPKDATTVIPFVPPFKVVGKESTLLCDHFKSK